MTFPPTRKLHHIVKPASGILQSNTHWELRRRAPDKLRYPLPHVHTDENISLVHVGTAIQFPCKPTAKPLENLVNPWVKVAREERKNRRCESRTVEMFGCFQNTFKKS